MKLSKFFIAGLLCVGLIACSNEIGNEPGKGPDDTPAQKGYISLFLKGTTITKADDGDDVEGTDEENAIGSVVVLMDYAKTAGDFGAVPAVLKRQDIETMKTTDDDGTLVTAAFPVEQGFYRVWIVANPIDGIDRAPGWKPEELVLNDIEDGVGATDNQFLMFNECTAAGQITYAEITVTGDNGIGNPAGNRDNPIVLERLAAKIESQVLTNIDFEGLHKQYKAEDKTDVKIAYNGCALLNGPESVYLQQHWDDNKLKTPDNLTHYWNMVDYRGTGGTEELTGLFDEEMREPDGNNENKITFYSMENKHKERPTGLIHKFTLTDDGKEAGEKAHFYYFCQTGQYFRTAAAITQAVTDYYKKNMLPEGNNSTDVGKDFTDELGDLNGDGISAFHDKWDVKVYWNGEMYYIYNIHDNKYDETALYRNTIYRLTATKLLNIGNYLPDTSADDKNWMEVTVSVKDWRLNLNNNIILK